MTAPNCGSKGNPKIKQLKVQILTERKISAVLKNFPILGVLSIKPIMLIFYSPEHRLFNKKIN